MNFRTSSLALALLASASALLLPNIAHAGVVGHYNACTGQGNAAMANAITAAGHTPVDIATPDATSLAALDVLMVNRSYCDATEYMANLPAITSAVQGGMVLLMHDRIVAEPGYVSAANALPGAAAISFTVSYSSNIDFPAGSPLLTGPGGTLTNTTLDGGNYSNHGYAAASGSMPAGSSIQANNGNPAQAVNFTYPYGGGAVVYSTIPLDFYIGGSSAFSTQYAPNVIAWAVTQSDQFVSCAAEGFTGIKLTLCRQICELPQSPATLAALIKTYMAAFRQEPPCAR